MKGKLMNILSFHSHREKKQQFLWTIRLWWMARNRQRQQFTKRHHITKEKKRLQRNQNPAVTAVKKVCSILYSPRKCYVSLHDNFAIFDLCGLWSIRRGESPERKKLDTMKQNNKQLPSS